MLPPCRYSPRGSLRFPQAAKLPLEFCSALGTSHANRGLILIDPIVHLFEKTKVAREHVLDDPRIDLTERTESGNHPAQKPWY